MAHTNNKKPSNRVGAIKAVLGQMGTMSPRSLGVQLALLEAIRSIIGGDLDDGATGNWATKQQKTDLLNSWEIKELYQAMNRFTSNIYFQAGAIWFLSAIATEADHSELDNDTKTAIIESILQAIAYHHQLTQLLTVCSNFLYELVSTDEDYGHIASNLKGVPILMNSLKYYLPKDGEEDIFLQMLLCQTLCEIVFVQTEIVSAMDPQHEVLISASVSLIQKVVGNKTTDCPAGIVGQGAHILKLCFHKAEDKQSVKKIFVDARGIEAVASAMAKFPSDESIQNDSCTLLFYTFYHDSLGDKFDEKILNSIASCGGLLRMLMAMKAFSKNRNILNVGISLLFAVWDSCTRSHRLFAKRFGCIELIVTAVKEHEDFADHGSCLMTRFVDDDPENLSDILKYNGIGALLKVLQRTGSSWEQKAETLSLLIDFLYLDSNTQVLIAENDGINILISLLRDIASNSNSERKIVLTASESTDLSIVVARACQLLCLQTCNDNMRQKAEKAGATAIMIRVIVKFGRILFFKAKFLKVSKDGHVLGTLPFWGAMEVFKTLLKYARKNAILQCYLLRALSEVIAKTPSEMILAMKYHGLIPEVFDTMNLYENVNEDIYALALKFFNELSP